MWIQKYNSLSATWTYYGNGTLQSYGNDQFNFLISSEDSLLIAVASGEHADNGYLFKFDGSKWATQGKTIFKAGESGSTLSIAIDQNGNKFAAYSDFGNGNKITVKVLKENIWANMPITSFATPQNDMAPICLNPDGVPYILFSQPSNGGKVSVLKMSFDP
jgi:hypothetical protein